MDQPITPGSRLGRYEIVSLLGSGGMGDVWRAHDTRLDRTVAIKILPEGLARDASLRERLEREARVISQLNHPNICTLYDIGDGYLVMELIDGESLADRLKQGPLPLDEVYRVGAELADALDRAHRAGIVHRDLKPGNVMLTRTGAKLLDFGVAKSQFPTSAHQGTTMMKPLTQVGTIIGTVQYMSPEQLEGGEADARTDVYALGVVLYEMITGIAAFQGKSTSSLIAAVIGTQPKPIHDLHPSTPPALEHLVQMCIAKDPEHRWQSARDVGEQLRWMSGGRADLRPRRVRWPWMGRAVAALLVVAALGVLASRFGFRAGKVEDRGRLRLDITPPRGWTFSQTMAIAPDGKRVAFRATDSWERSSLWLRSLDAPEVRALAGTDEAMYPFWSPDGRYLGFFAQGTLKRIDTTNGEILSICDAGIGGGATWSRDGTIVFAPFLGSGLFRVSSSGGSPAPVTKIRAEAGDVYHIWPWFLPDGEHFLFLIARAAKPAFAVGSIGGGAPKEIIALEGLAQLSAIQYANGSLFYLRERALLVQPFDADELEVRGDPMRLAEDVEVSGPGRAAFSVSRNDVVVYRRSASPPTTQLAWIDAQRQETPVAMEAAHWAGIVSDVISPLDRSLALSPDETQAMLTRAAAAEFPAVWSIDLDRGSAARAASEPWSAFPVYSPDGARMLFSGGGQAPPTIFVCDAASGANTKRLSFTGEQEFPTDWSRDGRTIVLTKFDDRTWHDIMLMPADGATPPKPLLHSKASERDGKLAPDGAFLAYVSNESGRDEVYVTTMPAAIGRWPISTDGGRAPRWSKDGAFLYFVAPGHRIMRVRVTARTPFTVSRSMLVAQVDENGFAVANDGRLLVNKIIASAEAAPIIVDLGWRQ